MQEPKKVKINSPWWWCPLATDHRAHLHSWTVNMLNLKPRPFKLLPAFWCTIACWCNRNFDILHSKDQWIKAVMSVVETWTKVKIIITPAYNCTGNAQETFKNGHDISKRSVKFKMNLWGHHFSQNANQKFKGFMPWKFIRG